VDTLTVIAHDRFEAVIQQARAADSIVRVKTVTIGAGGDIPDTASRVVEIRPTFDTQLTGRSSGFDDSDEQAHYILDQPEARHAAGVALDFITQRYERQVARAADLRSPEIRQRIAEDVRRSLAPDQGSLDVGGPAIDIDKIVSAVTDSLVQNLIEIPEIVVLPSRDVTFWFEDFDLGNLDHIRFQPVSETILIRSLREDTQRELAKAVSGVREVRAENYIVRHLIGNPQVDYDTQADLLYKLAGQMLDHLRSYLGSEDDVENVALVRGKQLADSILEQMMRHYHETPTDYRARVVRAFRTLRPFAVSAVDNAKVLPLTIAASPLSETRRYLFSGSSKSPYTLHRFHSDPERRFAALIDSGFEQDVTRWLKPAPGQFSIEYQAGKTYEPDFVVETTTEKLIVEVKADNETADPIVLIKARAASEWVRLANDLSADGAGKPWSYVMVPESALNASATLAGLRAVYARAS
jgi:type III restriction enzyme